MRIKLYAQFLPLNKKYNNENFFFFTELRGNGVAIEYIQVKTYLFKILLSTFLRSVNMEDGQSKMSKQSLPLLYLIYPSFSIF